MSSIRVLQPRNRLAELIGRAEGSIPIADALQRATNNIELVREDCMRAVDDALDALQEALPRDNAPPAARRLEELYELANEIVAVAATFDLREASRAAYSLCELLDRFRASGAWSARAVVVHIEALRLLRAPSDDVAGRASILAGLDQVLYMTARER